MGGDKVLALTTGLDNEGARGKRIAGRIDAILNERHLPGVRSFPKARELLLGVVTSAYENCTRLLGTATCAT